MQHECSQQWKLTDVEAINVLKCCRPSVKNCVAGIGMHCYRVRKIGKRNATTVFQGRFENENWNHVIECCKNKDNREEWGKYLGKKIDKNGATKMEQQKRQLKKRLFCKGNVERHK